MQLGVDVATKDGRILAEAFKKPVQVSAMCAGHMLQWRRTAFDYHFNHRVVILDEEKLGALGIKRG